MLMPVCGKWERQQGRSCHWHCTAPQLSFPPSRYRHQSSSKVLTSLFSPYVSLTLSLWEGGKGVKISTPRGLLGVVEAEQLLLSADHIILAGGTDANHYLIIKPYPHTSDRDPQANNVF